MKTCISILLILFIPFSAWSQTKVAILISGYGNQGDTQLSYDLEELAQSYTVLTENGIDVDIVSPQGGAVPVHDKKDHITYIKAFKNQASSQLMNTISAQAALKNDYQGLMIIGGDGAVFDLPTHQGTIDLITQFVNKDMPIAAVCHGPAALVNIRRADGSYYVANKRVNSFTKIEDAAFKKEHIDKYPFIVQTELEARGAVFVSNSPMLPYVMQDENLITAQNPMSVAKATEALVLKLGHSPKKRVLFKDEATFQLIAQAKSEGVVLLDVALSRAKENYDIQYLALYGFYAYKLALTPASQLVELHIMEVIGKHFSHPKYSEALIAAYLEQGMIEKAQQEKQILFKTYPDYQGAKQIKSAR